MNCIFCQIAEKKIKTQLVYEDEEILAFNDIAPQSPTHLLIIPKKHIPSLNHLNDDDIVLAGRLMMTIQHLARTLGVSDAGFRVVINTGLEGGQTVEHLHFHLMAGRAMTWPPG